MGADSTQGRAAAAVMAWSAKLDQLDYYEILRVPARDASGQPPTPEALRQAFNGFAGAFHPERYKAEEPAVLEAATRIFRRGNEALRVLTNPQLRQKYDFDRRTGVLRLSVDEIARASSSRIPAVQPVSPVAQASTGVARSPTPGAQPDAPGAESASPGAKSSVSPAAPAESFESIVTTAAAALFAKEADRMLARGEEKRALLQLRIAASKEPANHKLAQRVDALALASAKR